MQPFICSPKKPSEFSDLKKCSTHFSTTSQTHYSTATNHCSKSSPLPTPTHGLIHTCIYTNNLQDNVYVSTVCNTIHAHAHVHVYVCVYMYVYVCVYTKHDKQQQQPASSSSKQQPAASPQHRASVAQFPNVARVHYRQLFHVAGCSNSHQQQQQKQKKTKNK